MGGYGDTYPSLLGKGPGVVDPVFQRLGPRQAVVIERRLGVGW